MLTEARRIAEVSLTLLCASLPLIPQLVKIVRRALGFPSATASSRSYRRTGGSCGSSAARSRPRPETSSSSRLDEHKASWAELSRPPTAAIGPTLDSKSDPWLLPGMQEDLERGWYGDAAPHSGSGPDVGGKGITKTVKIEQSFLADDRRGSAVRSSAHHAA